ncbi:asparagine synthetase [Aspergillus sclerotioniger CBS 115572]|uniref:Asparagine synthetase n=1 Tax=Aspergillus sclerotioniger CBS 115572 TaxID=1450535 RepID=A0A317WX26_9EURO|nr:asparagine synthetase [Aspergillus sclerotioniger CBS 115572]PWY90451.1 asparagine synthetase [Aspergillus sclerotioniger CBS 115572]
MCGLTAFVALCGSPSYQDEEMTGAQDLGRKVNDSLDLIKHRGPDARGQWFSSDYRVGLGHVRLSIIDLSPAGNQPFHDSDDNIHAVVNGELYDYERIKAELADEYDFKSKSDCEVVIALYRHYGESFLSHLRGEFALVLWDAKRQLFIAARDRYGIKSLYYTVVGGRLLVSTEMKCFLPFGWKPEWDVVNLREKGWTYGPQMYFKGVYRVGPGQYLMSQGFKGAQVKTYWDLSYPDKHRVYLNSEAETVARVRELLLESLQHRLRADVGVGVFLSGGLDSSAIAGMTAHVIRQGKSLGNDASGKISNLSCFTVQFEKDSGLDESDIARRTAEWLGVDFHPVLLDEETIAARLEDTVWHTETPIPDVNGMGRLALADAAHAAGKRVILTGEGSDEHFSGYADFLWSYLLEPDHAWASSSNIMAEPKKMRKVADELIANGFLGALPRSTDAEAAQKLNKSSVFPRLDAVFQPPFQQWVYKYSHNRPEMSFAESLSDNVLADMATKWHPLNSSQYQWTKCMLANYILRYLGDNIDMVYQIESRPPFLDHHLTEYVNRIPPSLKIKYDPVKRTFREKHILREAMKPFITEEVYNRTKQPYVGPTKYKRKGPVYKILKKLVTEANVQVLGFLDWHRVQDGFVRAFRDHDTLSFKNTLMVAQLVVLGKRFGVKTAEDPQKPLPVFEDNGSVVIRSRL